MSKGPQRYSKEIIQSAIQKLEDGGSLSAIARDMGLPKTTVKYWIDNANKFLADGGVNEGLNTKVARVQNQILDYGWRLLFRLYKKIQGKMDDASFRDLVYGASELQSRLTQIRTLHGSIPDSSSMMEVSEETKVTVRTFLEKKKAKENSAPDGENIDLATAPVDRGHEGEPPTEEASPGDLKGEENGANG
ncbi:MAG: hypothetical protein KCHDKBKB_01061 [Elusimicrobia bacterium]|nr:hypothetical protein [Elusimicrobiota bacterium]